MAARAVPWVAPVFYGAVLLAGLTASGGPRWTLAGFTCGLVVLAALDQFERLRHPTGTPVATATTLLVARVVSTAIVIALDPSQVSRVLIVLIPFQAYFAFGRLVSLALAGSFLAAAPVVLATTDPAWYRNVEQLGDLLMLTLGMVMAVAMAAVAVEAQTGRARLEQAQGELAELSAAAERARLARDIHDSVGHHLTAIAVQLEKSAAFRDLDGAAADRALANARQSARLALTDVRIAVRALREASGPTSLAARLDELAARLSGASLRISAELIGTQEGYDSATLTALYRVAQEGLTNTVRHANASRAAVRVCLGAESAELEVTDDGCGLPSGGGEGPGADTAAGLAGGAEARHEPSAVAASGPGSAGPAAVGLAADPLARPEPWEPRTWPAGYGLLGIQERVLALGGRLQVRTAPGAGTTLTVTVPRVTP